MGGRPSRKAKATRRDKSDEVIAKVAKVEELVEKKIKRKALKEISVEAKSKAVEKQKLDEDAKKTKAIDVTRDDKEAKVEKSSKVKAVKVEKSTKAKAAKAEKSEVKAEEAAPRLVTVTVKGRAPVDGTCSVRDSHHVLAEGTEVWDAMLNHTNIQNNNNKFYIIQLLEADSGPGRFGVWMRWGRVGKVGQSKWELAGSMEEAKRSFTNKFFDKTRNDWEDREAFEKVPGKYDLVTSAKTRT